MLLLLSSLNLCLADPQVLVVIFLSFLDCSLTLFRALLLKEGWRTASMASFGNLLEMKHFRSLLRAIESESASEQDLWHDSYAH